MEELNIQMEIFMKERYSMDKSMEKEYLKQKIMNMKV